MRTTLTLDDDVALSLERLRARADLSLKAAVNEALRVGLRQLEEPEAPGVPYRTPSVDLGSSRFGALDDVAEALAAAEGEAFR